MVHGILLSRILRWIAVPFSRGSSQPRDRTQVSHVADRLTNWPQGKYNNTGVGKNKENKEKTNYKISWLTLCDPMGCSPSGSSIHRILWVLIEPTGVGCHLLLQGISPTQGSNAGLLHCKKILYYLSHQGSPFKADRLFKNINVAFLIFYFGEDSPCRI